MKILFTNIHQQTTWINDDENYSLIAISGLQPPKATIQLGSLPGVDGSMHLHSKVEQRTINLTLQILGDGESNRRKLAQIFKIKQMGSLRLELSNQKVRIDAIVESVEVLPMSWPMRALITLICPQPYFEDEQSIQLELASIDQLFQFPLSLSAEGQAIGNLSPSTAINAYNSGDMDIGFKIRFQCIAPIENPKLIHLTTGEYIQLMTSMNAGQVIEIQTEMGQKRIEQINSNERFNLFHTLKLGSTFFQLREKDNILFATCDVGASWLMTEIIYRVKTSGV